MSNPLSFATLADLTTAIEAFVEDTGAELTTDINTIIQLGEAKCYTDLNLETLDTVIEYQVTAANPIQAIKPADHLGIRSLHWRDHDNSEGAAITGPYTKIARRTYEFCLEWASDPDSTIPPTEAGAPNIAPRYFCEYSPTEVYLAPSPAIDSWLVLRQIVKPPSIVDGATWLATTGGDLLLYACLVATEAYLKADDSYVARWKNEYQEILAVRRFEIRDTIRADYAPTKNAARTVEDKP